MKTVGELIEKLEKFDKGLPIQALIMGGGYEVCDAPCLEADGIHIKTN